MPHQLLQVEDVEVVVQAVAVREVVDERFVVIVRALVDACRDGLLALLDDDVARITIDLCTYEPSRPVEHAFAAISCILA